MRRTEGQQWLESPALRSRHHSTSVVHSTDQYILIVAFNSLPTLSVLNIYDLLRHWSCSSAVSSSSDYTNPLGGWYTQAGKKTPWRRSQNRQVQQARI
jgi:hypothetical protein